MSSIHDLAALAAEINIARPEGDGGDQIDGDKYEDDEDDSVGGMYMEA